VGQCNIDHSHEDVIQKLESQLAFIPKHVGEALQRFLKNQHSQQTLNELFHLLKKYDLASKEEQEERNQKFIQVIN
jgi:citrate synthase